MYGLYPGTLPYCMVVWLKSNYNCICMLSHYCIISHYIGLPKEYLEFNQTKAIVGVYGSGSNVLYSLYTNAHPLYGVVIKSENL